MPRLLPLLPLLTLTALVACTPMQRPPATHIAPQMTLQGNAVNVTLTNAGPYDLLLENTCPRPFAVNFTDYPGKSAGGLMPRQLDTCAVERLRPVTWPVGQSLNVSIPVTYPAGTHTLKGFATIRARVLQPKGAANNYADMNVNLPDLTFTVK